MKKKILVACDFSQNTGEGVLGREFVKVYKKFNKDTRITKKFFSLNSVNKNKFSHKYILPLFLALYVLLNYKKKFIFLNYLPLWNFLIFLILPKHTVLGPVTGGIYKKKVKNLGQFIRKYIFPLFFKLSKYLLKVKFKKNVYSTSLLQENKIVNKKILYNFVLIFLSLKKNRKNKSYDLIFYNRKHLNKFNKDLNNLVIEIAKTFRVCVIGDYLRSVHSNKINNKGYITRKKANRLMSISKFAICGPENLYSLFAIDAYNNNCGVLYNKKLSNFKFAKSKNFYPINYSFNKKNYKSIAKLIKKNKFYKDEIFINKIERKKDEINSFFKND